MFVNTFSLMIKTVARKILPITVRRTVLRLVVEAGELKTNLQLAWLRKRVWPKKPGSLVQCFDYTVRINDGPNFYILYKDIFLNRIYHFESRRADPLILDCGSNIGVSILYFKHVYPRARIIGFEPDPEIFPYLKENVARNGLTDVKLLQSAVAGREGTLVFFSDGKYGSCLAKNLSTDCPAGWTKHEVSCVRLRDYLTAPVDFLKMNIEGAEWEVLKSSEDLLGQVKEMVIEYHHLPGSPQTLHQILELLHRTNFLYVVSDFGFDTYGGVQLPIQLNSNTRYYRHIYACREDSPIIQKT